MNHALRRFFYSVVVSGLAMGFSVRGEETGAVLPDYVVTALRYETDAMVTPYVSRTVGADLADGFLARTTPDALTGLPSVMIQKTSYGQGSPFLRGLTGFRTLLMVDGIRLNNAVFRDGPNQYWNTVDPFSINRYEVVMGPASVLYGSDAMGGAVNALTPEPLDWNGEAAWERRMAFRGGTADESTQWRGEVSGRFDEAWSIAAGYSLKAFGDVHGGEEVGDQPKTGYDEVAFDGRLDYFFKGGARLTLAHQQVDQEDAWRTHRTVYGIDWQGLKHGDDKVHTYDQQRALTYLRLEDGAGVGAGIDSYRLTLSRHAQLEDRYRTRADDRRDEQGFEVTTWGVAAEFTSVLPVGPLVYGMDYYRDDVDSYSRKFKADGSFGGAEAQGPVADDATYGLLGLFVQNTIKIMDSGLELTPGVRYTHAHLGADKVLDPLSGSITKRDEAWDHVAGSLRALVPLDENGERVVFAGVSQGFRAPNLSDLTRLDSARSNEIETPVEQLDPEQIVSGEAGVRARGERFHAEAAYYYTWMDDLIVRKPTGREIDGLLEVTKRNAGEGYVQGVEASFRLDVTEEWTVRLAGSWMDGEADAYPSSSPEQVRETLSRVMPLTAQVALRWQLSGRWWMEAVVDAAAKADRLSSGDKRDTQRIPPGGTPGYTVVSLVSGCRIGDGLDLTLSLENVSDEDYRIHGSGVNEPGRQLIAGVSYSF